jgi:phage-related protein
VDVRASLDNQIDRLNMLLESDPPLPFPHSSQVDGELRELRAHHGRLLFRILYRRSRNLFVLLHACSKFSRKLPQEDIDIAKARWEDFRAWMADARRRPPRRIGRRAP